VKIQSDQASFFYTADTGWEESLIEASRGVDLLLAETTFRSYEKDLLQPQDI
jgi:ribonuclease BN (tRNA processing enzyme)